MNPSQFQTGDRQSPAGRSKKSGTPAADSRIGNQTALGMLNAKRRAPIQGFFFDSEKGRVLTLDDVISIAEPQIKMEIVGMPKNNCWIDLIRNGFYKYAESPDSLDAQMIPALIHDAVRSCQQEINANGPDAFKGHMDGLDTYTLYRCTDSREEALGARESRKVPFGVGFFSTALGYDIQYVHPGNYMLAYHFSAPVLRIITKNQQKKGRFQEFGGIDKKKLVPNNKNINANSAQAFFHLKREHGTITVEFLRDLDLEADSVEILHGQLPIDTEESPSEVFSEDEASEDEVSEGEVSEDGVQERGSEKEAADETEDRPEPEIL